VLVMMLMFVFVLVLMFVLVLVLVLVLILVLVLVLAFVLMAVPLLVHTPWLHQESGVESFHPRTCQCLQGDTSSSRGALD
jgi:hypothetical protein